MPEWDEAVADAFNATEPEFESLLRRAAHVSALSASARWAPTFLPGHTLLDGRLRVLRRIGEGGMGVVYEVYDERRRGKVALKTLSRLEANGVYRLKHEFRSLADVAQRNLCRLYELFSEGDWFFTMELVEGERFDDWVRPHGVLDEARLRAALPQLAEATDAIHRAGKLHRDLKPSNVLVTGEGRVVVLDFGLAVDKALGGVGQTLHDESVSGTPAYMAPEQAAGAGALPASDCYALGAMLFEALTGGCPFEGRVGEILAAKQRDAAPRVCSVCPDAAPDLSALCDALLEREPAKRPDASELRARFGPLPRSSFPPPESRKRELLLGRERELCELGAAYDAMLAGRPVVLCVAGESGMGKSALVGHFLDDVRTQGQAAVLAGRCYERESVPFKAFDSVVDDLSRYLRRLPREEASALMPREVFALARLFPVLERVSAVAEAPRKEIPDAQELQQRAFAAFGELFGRLRDRRPVLVYVDDLQWTDSDSVRFMQYLFAQQAPTPLLLIVSHRSEGASENALLQRALQAARDNPELECRELTVGRLPPAAATELAARMLDDSRMDPAAIAKEAAGSPFFLGELVGLARSPAAAAQRLTLQQAVMHHVQGLNEGARSLLDVLAVAGRPLAVDLALDAARATHEAVDQLLCERLLRGAGAGTAARTLECYHDKIREYVSAALAEEPLRLVHQHLAEQLAAAPSAASEQLALHLHGAGQLGLAAVHYERAGDASVLALAFDHAASQYQRALSLSGATAPSGLRAKLGAALASAGSSRAAAEIYRSASASAPAEQALEHTRTAAYLLTTSGYLDEGRSLLGEVLLGIGLSLPRSRRGALASALLSRAQLRLRGFRLSESSAPSRSEEARLGALWTVVQGSLGNDPFLMVEMSARYTRLALDSGAKAHAARALSMEAYLGSFDGPPTQARSLGLLTQAEALATPLNEPELSGWVKEMRGCVLVHEGRFAEARPVLREALDWFTTRCKGVPFELACGRGYDLNAANHLGQFAEISRSASAIVDDSLRRGDMYQASGVASFAMPGWLAHRGLAYARGRFGEAKRLFRPQTSFQWADYLMLMAELSLALYEGQPERGVALAAARWPALERSQLLRMQIARAMMVYCRAGCRLAASSPQRPSVELSLVAAAARTLRKTPLMHAHGWAAVLEAGLAQRNRRAGRAAEQLGLAITRLDASGLRMFAAAARRRLGQILGGQQGAASLREAELAMVTEGIVDIEATTEMLAPGLRL
jgi:predicted Ser/Thr protein kinase